MSKDNKKKLADLETRIKNIEKEKDELVKIMFEKILKLEEGTVCKKCGNSMKIYMEERTETMFYCQCTVCEHKFFPTV